MTSRPVMKGDTAPTWLGDSTLRGPRKGQKSPESPSMNTTAVTEAPRTLVLALWMGQGSPSLAKWQMPEQNGRCHCCFQHHVLGWSGT